MPYAIFPFRALFKRKNRYHVLHHGTFAISDMLSCLSARALFLKKVHEEPTEEKSKQREEKGRQKREKGGGGRQGKEEF